MTVENANIIDYVVVDHDTGNTFLVVCDHLPWGQDEGEHLQLLQNKFNAYLAYVEGGQLHKEWPKSVGKKVAFEVHAMYPLSEQASRFYQLAGGKIAEAGFSLQFKHRPFGIGEGKALG
jgi:hypothetical protein